MTLRPMGDGAWRLDRPPRADAAAVFRALRALPGVVDVVVTDRHALVTFAPARPPPDPAPALAAVAPLADGDRARHVIRARYDGEDLDAVAASLALSREDVVARHAGRAYRVELVGFLPGFAYLGPLDPVLAAVPRRASPRPRVPAGAVAIAAGRTGVYPFASPGGWHLLGTAVDFVPFSAARGAALHLGDDVRFEAADAPPAVAPSSPRARSAPPRVGLVVERAGLGATVQDLGRPGHMHDGVPPGGALVPAKLVAANRALGNPDGAPGVEVPLAGARFRAVGALHVALDGRAHALADGDRLDVPAGPDAVRYLALPGGVDAPRVLGGCGTLLVAGLGGHEGRTLRAGDALRPARERPVRVGDAVPADDDPAAPIRVVPGPDPFPPAALDALLRRTFTVSPASDRVGTRLDGARLPCPPRDRAGSGPMVRGAIEVTLDGGVIVLGPDHPTTGGYPVIAVVASRDHGRLARRRPGATVRFEARPPVSGRPAPRGG